MSETNWTVGGRDSSRNFCHFLRHTTLLSQRMKHPVTLIALLNFFFIRYFAAMTTPPAAYQSSKGVSGLSTRACLKVR